MHIGQSKTTPLVLEREPLVVDAHQVHDGRLEVVHMHRVLDDVVADLVGFTVGDAGTDAAAGHPVGETARMMVAPVIGACDIAIELHNNGELESLFKSLG